MKHHYGWRRDLPDLRDKQRPYKLTATLPTKVDLSPLMPPVYNQGALGSCSANAIAGAIEYARLKQKLTDFVPSRLFIYYNERVIENSVDSDAGAELRDGIKSVSTQGACPETDWPYDISKFTDKPSPNCYADAKTDLVKSYQRVVQSTFSLKECLASGHPVIFGFTVYESFETEEVAETGIVPMPSPYEEVLGGHAVLAVGYDDSKKMVLVRNSWGPDWGVKGYFWMPYTYIVNPDLAADFWQIDSVST